MILACTMMESVSGYPKCVVVYDNKSQKQPMYLLYKNAASMPYAKHSKHDALIGFDYLMDGEL